MQKFFQKKHQETETVRDVISNDEQEQEQQSSIIISPTPSHPHRHPLDFYLIKIRKTFLHILIISRKSRKI